MRRLTKEPWFGPKRHLGWGWTPVSWQGWIVTLVFLALIVGTSLAVHTTRLKMTLVLVLILLFLGVIALTGDPPGGP